MHLRSSLLTLALFGVVGLACGEDKGKPTGALCPTTQTLTYENFGQNFFETFCNDCHAADSPNRHDAPPEDTFDDVAMIRDAADEIDTLAAAGPDATNKIMPDDDPRPTDAQRAQLGEWLACGAP
jgi:hypothetical protein